MPPRSSTSFCSGSRSITGYGVSGSISVEFAPSRPSDVPRELGDRDVHAEADAEVRDPALARDAAGEDLALPAARAEAARHEHAVDLVERRDRLLVRHVLRVDPAHVHARAVVDARVLERLVHREVGVVQLHVLADERDLDLALLARRSAPSARATRRGRPAARRARAASRRARRGPLPAAPAGRGRRRGRRGSRSRRRARRRRRARSCRGCPSESSSRERQTTMSGWIPMRRSSLTECCVGFVFSSPAASMNGTSVTWR